MEYVDQQLLQDLNLAREKEINTGLEICPVCGKETPHKEMTASVSRGIMCQSCVNHVIYLVSKIIK